MVVAVERYVRMKCKKYSAHPFIRRAVLCTSLHWGESGFEVRYHLVFVSYCCEDQHIMYPVLNNVNGPNKGLHMPIGSHGDGGGKAGGLGHCGSHGLRLSSQGGDPRQGGGGPYLFVFHQRGQRELGQREL
jgi:hypothetical protein